MGDLVWIAWVLAVVGLITGYIYFRLNRKVKRIEWSVVLDQSLLMLPSASALSGRVSVNIDNHTLEQPRAVALKVKNTGNVGLSTKSMYRPFELSVSTGSHVKTLTVTRIRASDDESERLASTIPPDASMIPLPETLLNPGDELRCSLLVDGLRGGVSVKGEAEDFTIVNKREPSVERLKRREQALSTSSALLSAGAALGAVTALVADVLGK